QLLVECSVENATQGSIYLSSSRLDCAEGLKATLLSGADDDGGGSSMQLLKKGGSHSLVFTVTSSDDSLDSLAIRQLDAVGSLALGWHVPDGPSGCAEGHAIKVKPVPASLGLQGLDLQVLACPRQVKVEVPFQLEFEVTNRTSTAVEPRIHFDIRLMGAVRVHGATQRSLSRLEPNCSAKLPVELLVTIPGLHGLQGVFVCDGSSTTRAEFGVLCDVLAF
ncbi:unnamed protein product, partial [Polarella glacialis]